MQDMKQGRAGGKPDLTHIRKPLMVYGGRGGEYGNVKYERANYLREVGEEPHPNAADFERLREYSRAALGHIADVLDSMEMHQSTDPKLEDVAGMKKAAYAADGDTKAGDKVGPSWLPHFCGAVASLNMALAQAVEYGLLPQDPGRPWEDSHVNAEAFAECLEAVLQNATDKRWAFLPPTVWRLETTNDVDGIWLLVETFDSYEEANEAIKKHIVLDLYKARYRIVESTVVKETDLPRPLQKP